eukprot:56338_1
MTTFIGEEYKSILLNYQYSSIVTRMNLIADYRLFQNNIHNKIRHHGTNIILALFETILPIPNGLNTFKTDNRIYNKPQHQKLKKTKTNQ